jgi:hypothetical protein
LQSPANLAAIANCALFLLTQPDNGRVQRIGVAQSRSLRWLGIDDTRSRGGTDVHQIVGE